MTVLERTGNPTVTDVPLATDEVHVWWASLDEPRVQIERLARLLSVDERMQADRFYFERDKNRFLVGRGLLRTILGRYLGADPGGLRFRYGPRGKPALADKFALRFNLAHSQGVAVYAVTRGREIGIDVECIRPVPDAEQIARSCFSARENAALRSLPVSQKPRAFFNCWTRKEAFVKATGDGLAHPLDTFDVSLAPEEPARLISVHGDPQETSRWSLEALELTSNYVAALVAEGHGWRLACRHWPG